MDVLVVETLVDDDLADFVLVTCCPIYLCNDLQGTCSMCTSSIGSTFTGSPSSLIDCEEGMPLLLRGSSAGAVAFVSIPADHRLFGIQERIEIAYNRRPQISIAVLGGFWGEAAKTRGGTPLRRRRCGGSFRHARPFAKPSLQSKSKATQDRELIVVYRCKSDNRS